MSELLRLIQERRAELQRAALAELGPIDDARRVEALLALIAKAAHDPDSAVRLEQCADLLGAGFRALVVEYAARQKPEEEPEEESAADRAI